MTFSESWEVSSRLERLAFVSVAIASGISLFFSIAGFPAVGHDSNVHLNWLEQFSRLFHQGVLYPRWLNDSNWGFGSPTFYFYPPLPYWFASLLRYVLPFAPSPFFNLVTLSATIGSIWTSHLLLRQYTHRPIIAWTATLAYSFLAYRFADAFVRDALGEHWALTFLPLLFVRRDKQLSAIATQAIGWTGLVLSSIPMLLCATLCVAIFDVVRKNRQDIISHALSFVLALIVGAAYLLPAIQFQHTIHYEHLVWNSARTSGFALLDLFLFPGQLRFLASVTLLAGISALILTWRMREFKGWSCLALLLATLQLPIFWYLWRAPGFREYVQFSWRLNAVLLLAIAVLYAVRRDRRMDIVLVALAAVTIFSEVRLSNEFFTHPKLALDQYRRDAPQYVPIWASQNDDEVAAVCRSHYYDKLAVLLGLTTPQDSIYLKHYFATERSFSVNLSRPAPARFHLLYWPYWKLTSDGQTILLEPDANGFAQANLPPGQYDIHLQLIRSDAEIYGTFISILGLLCLVSISVVAAYREMKARFETT